MAGAAPAAKVSPGMFDHPGARRLAAWLLEEGRRLPPGTPVPILEIQDRDLAALARRLELMQEDPPPDPVEDVLAHLEERSVNRQKDELRLRLKSLDRGRDEEEYLRTMKDLMILQRRGSGSDEEQVWTHA